jgi:hypothetical protein
MHAPVPISKWTQLRQLPNTAGVYIIYSGNQPWYVGVARNAVRDRFLHRAKALRDMNIPEQLLAERSVALVTLKGPAPSCAVTRKAAGTASVVRPVSGQDAALSIVEQFFIAKCKTKAANRGNHLSEAVRVAGSGPLTIVVHKSNGSSKPYSFAPKQV